MMDAFISREKLPSSPPDKDETAHFQKSVRCGTENPSNEDEPTDFKLAILASLYPDRDGEVLLEVLLLSGGSIEDASEALKQNDILPPKKRPAPSGVGYQSSLSSYIDVGNGPPTKKRKTLPKKGETMHLYTPSDVESYTPCSIIHNFLPAQEADALLLELLKEAPTYNRTEFQLYGRTVTTRNTFCFYVDSPKEMERQKRDYFYDGKRTEDVRCCNSEMLKASVKVQEAVNNEVQRRIRDFYPDGTKLKHQSPDLWKPNAAFVNCYAGSQESLGYHSDQLTYLGPRAVVGSLSLGVAREFRVRKIVFEDDESLPDVQGQISIHLPHNSLLIMHAEMQEEWKHSITPTQKIDPHPLSGNTRINITYRHYREYMHPNSIPKCKCGIPSVLRVAQRKKENRGRYMWMCHTNYVPRKQGCSFFQWAEFDDDGLPSWAKI